MNHAAAPRATMEREVSCRTERVARAARLLTRIARLCLHLGWGLILTQWLRHDYGAYWFRLPHGQSRRRHWQQNLADILGLRVHCAGTPMSVAGLLVANHVSWLDSVALASAVSTNFVAKDDVRRWPIIGHLTRSSGTVFLRRGDQRALARAVDTLADAIGQNQRVVFFPEGTTTFGDTLGTFRPGLFQAAVKTNTPVQAVAVRYRRAGQRDAIAPFIGSDAFVPHLLRVMAAPQTDVHLDFQTVTHASDRRTLATRTHLQIATVLDPRQQENPVQDQPELANNATVAPIRASC